MSNNYVKMRYAQSLINRIVQGKVQSLKKFIKYQLFLI